MDGCVFGEWRTWTDRGHSSTPSCMIWHRFYWQMRLQCVARGAVGGGSVFMGASAEPHGDHCQGLRQSRVSGAGLALSSLESV